jgi:hypothetical protein
MHHGVNKSKINHNKLPNTPRLNLFLMDLASFKSYTFMLEDGHLN